MMEIFAYPHKLRDKFHIQLVDITFSLDTTTVQNNTIELLLLSFIVRKQRAVSIRGGRGGEDGFDLQKGEFGLQTVYEIVDR